MNSVHFSEIRNEQLCNKLIKNLKKRRFEAFYAKNGKEAFELATGLIPKEETVSWGGSVTLSDIGLTDFLINNGYNVINRDLAKNPEEKQMYLTRALMAHTYLTGANAITKDGELVNIDCIGNRVAALMFGPKNVIVIVGANKITNTLEEAINRAKNVAAPVNMQRITKLSGKKTPCLEDGLCHDCLCEDSICSNTVITRLCNPQGRIKVIVVNECLGF